MSSENRSSVNIEKLSEDEFGLVFKRWGKTKKIVIVSHVDKCTHTEALFLDFKHWEFGRRKERALHCCSMLGLRFKMYPII